jgi:hypothetical protein
VRFVADMNPDNKLDEILAIVRNLRSMDLRSMDLRSMELRSMDLTIIQMRSLADEDVASLLPGWRLAPLESQVTMVSA